MQVGMMVAGMMIGGLFGWVTSELFRKPVTCNLKPGTGELPEIEPVTERDMLSVGAMPESDACVRVPLHIAAGMRSAKEAAVSEMLLRATPTETGVERSAWQAAGYMRACVEFQRLWLELRERGGRMKDEG